jgi:hypothetical protein
MTTATATPDILAPRPAWRSLFWTVPITVGWTLLVTWQPGIAAGGVPMSALRLIVQALVALGLWLGLERITLTPVQRRTTWLAIVIPFTLWTALAWSAAIDGAFRPNASSLPLLPFAIFLPVIVGAPLLLFSKRVGQVLDAMPATWLVAFQVYRVMGSIVLAAGLRGTMTAMFAFPAGIGDVLTGLFAIPAAIALATGTAEGRKTAILWNIFGLADFTVAITLGTITSPGPFQLIFPNVPSIGASAYPDILIPALAVPSSILLHVLSLRQLMRR